MTPADLIRLAGPALYGECWAHPLARSLKVDPRTVEKWRDGQHTPAPGVYAEIVALLQARQINVAAALTVARALAADPPAQRRPGRKPASA